MRRTRRRKSADKKRIEDAVRDLLDEGERFKDYTLNIVRLIDVRIVAKIIRSAKSLLLLRG